MGLTEEEGNSKYVQQSKQSFSTNKASIVEEDNCLNVSYR